MHISLHLDSDDRWTWQLKDMSGQVTAVSTRCFESDSLAMGNALETCRYFESAPIYMSRDDHAASTELHVDAAIRAPERPAKACEFSRLLDAAGLDAALDFLNRGIVHRYTAMYRLNGEVLANVILIDKLGEVLPQNLANVPYSHSFCQFAIREGYFSTENSALDDRLDGHPAQGVMNSYHAFPLVADSGRVFGTVCHFDTAAHALDEKDFELLHAAAIRIAKWISKK